MHGDVCILLEQKIFLFFSDDLSMWFTVMSSCSRSYENHGSTTDERYAVNMVDDSGVSGTTYSICPLYMCLSAHKDMQNIEQEWQT